MASSSSELLARHIQDHNEANTTTKHYWAYPSRVLPCTKDAGTCEYLEAVYSGHVTSMLYTFILWGAILGVLAVWTVVRILRAGRASHGAAALLLDIGDRVSMLKRRLLPDAPMRWLFGRISRLQVVILAVMLAYLLVFSLVNIWYQTRVTPIKNSTLHNTRTGLGPWSDRIGALAYALTPFTVMLCMRESALSLITGIPYQHFNFLHRWLGRVIFVQSALHTIGWTIIEAKLYQPQPKTYVDFIKQQYMIFGCIAMAFVSFLTVFSTKWAIRKTGYECFKMTHWIIAVLYIGACWGHWDKLWCWMVPSLALIVIDQVVRGLRVAYIHMGGTKGSDFGFRCAQADVQVLTDDNGTVIRLDFDYEHRQPWGVGQHFYLTFPSLSIWQSHPYTVSSVPQPNSKVQHHTYLIRVRDGQTKTLAQLGNTTIPVILTGAYGNRFPSYQSQHILAIAGGTGVTFTYPIIVSAIQQCITKAAVLDFVWIVRKAEDLLWLSSELSRLKTLLSERAGLKVSIYVSRDVQHKLKSPTKARAESPLREKAGIETTVSSLSSRKSDVSLDELLAISHPRFAVHWLKDHHPSCTEIVSDFRERSLMVGGGAEIVGSGPEAMGSDLRAAVAKLEIIDEQLGFYWDSRE
ncbi:uncharacterized protein MYCFIDRAFT_57022 [Pseudocercospora fijiensis CIRAD86]|uniref:ferric-chelate reductase (NADPH) n=1 Tax=Pseudocercospora fijiensis (strain CIRAD86) TaxID=383855 RepID=N1Q9Q6_PSEFD|nr:uncharacterized protein MYCFIDRAFT_57022 [Pseudocercospora fijiensis CIRAD86]EME89630.1 hypothetical protein MYCFIDRAFT_57022 [Pseudocercospora fijiensis CIRAD86]